MKLYSVPVLPLSVRVVMAFFHPVRIVYWLIVVSTVYVVDVQQQFVKSQTFQ